jgi:tetratricopeptide (TPR) repeat protein
MLRMSRVAFSLALPLALSLAPRQVFADLELPRPSPFAKVSQDVGLTQITVDYSSPGVKGRPIWGALVPFDKMWRTGANQATKITFSKDVTFVDKPVPAGTYALFTIPAKNGEWTVILNKNADQAGTARDYKPELDLVRVKVHAKAAPLRERLAFMFSDFTDDKASLDLEWEKLRVSIPIKTNTGPQVIANINTALDNTWRTYANAARYMQETKKDYDSAMKYIDQSLALKEDWFNVWIKASVLAAKNNFKEARAQAQKAYDLGQKAGPGFFLEAEVKKAIADWSKKG